jgi:Fe-S cluster assembly iron-binding protein IscA
VSVKTPGRKDVTQMVNVTERARAKLKELLETEKLKELLETESDDQSVGLRLGKTTSGALGIFPDCERPDDQVVEHEGAAVLLVGREIAENVEGTTIDYEEGGPGPDS